MLRVAGLGRRASRDKRRLGSPDRTWAAPIAAAGPSPPMPRRPPSPGTVAVGAGIAAGERGRQNKGLGRPGRGAVGWSEGCTLYS